MAEADKNGQQDTPATRHHGEQSAGMGQRGVSRMQMAHDGEMAEEERRHMQIRHHKRTLWVYWTLVLLGFWMMASAVTFGYNNGVVDVRRRSCCP